MHRVDFIAALVCLVLALPAAAQSSDPVAAASSVVARAAQASATPAQVAAPDDDPDLDVNKSQPDFALATIPTTLRLPVHRMAFRLTHRFNEQIDKAKLAGLFGLDSGAQVGLELRYGLFRGAQLGFYRTADRTIEFFTQYDVVQQRKSRPIGLAVVASAEGTNNFKDSYSPSIGAVVSHELGTRGAFYVAPRWVNNSNPLPKELVDHNSSVILGVGARIRVMTTTYVMVEVNPRVGGYKPGKSPMTFAIEKRAGGHLFQLNFSNAHGTTPAQVARGGPDSNNWYLGFNLSRKFF
ncbi:MAG: DUF5777 family beta-barrel protein [Acidobacteriota bacterium]